MSLMTVILGREVSLDQQVIAGIWMVGVVLIWDLSLAAVISLPRVQSLLKRHIHRVERVSGVILIAFAIGLFI
jgi:threonine/homoserine/homoserine lactone efflux protein